jgi:hypothetical protein
MTRLTSQVSGSLLYDHDDEQQLIHCFFFFPQAYFSDWSTLSRLLSTLSLLLLASVVDETGRTMTDTRCLFRAWKNSRRDDLVDPGSSRPLTVVVLKVEVLDAPGLKGAVENNSKTNSQSSSDPPDLSLSPLKI